MNYGFPPSPNDALLAQTLKRKLVDKLPNDEYGSHPYIEVNSLYQGVRIRRITHYNEFIINRIVRDAENIYTELFGPA